MLLIDTSNARATLHINDNMFNKANLKLVDLEENCNSLFFENIHKNISHVYR